MNNPLVISVTNALCHQSNNTSTQASPTTPTSKPASPS